MYYVHTGRLGNYDVITDASGNVKERLDFNAWGNRRNPNNWAQTETTGTAHIFSRGYTGHEHLDAYNVINMNGRLYDPLNGKFFSPGPFVQMPDNTQSFNRYSYCANNSLMYTDPDGEWFGIDDLLGFVRRPHLAEYSTVLSVGYIEWSIVLPLGT